MRTFHLALGLGGILTWAACTTSEIGPLTPSDGSTAIFLTDAPFPFDGVSRVDVHVVSIAVSTSVDTAKRAPEWVPVTTPDRTFNLLDLQNWSTALLGAGDVPPGQYQAVRVVFDPARSSITTTDGEKIVSTSTPGSPGINWQSKAEDPELFALVEEAMAIDQNGEDIVIDFDVGRSFLYDDNGGFTFIPWLRAITRAGSGAVAGTVRGADGNPIPSSVVSVHYGTDSLVALGPLVATTRPTADGRFKASFLRPGRYQVVAEDLRRNTTAVKGVVVEAGETVDAGDFRF